MISFNFVFEVEGDRAGRSIAFNFIDKIERSSKKQIYNFQKFKQFDITVNLSYNRIVLRSCPK